MNVGEFIDKWKKAKLNEVAAFQTYFNDLCDLVGHDPPVTADPDGEAFKYEKFVIKPAGGSGFIDVVHKGKFIWEHKSKGENLDDAYLQALEYVRDAGNPPLIVVGDFERIIIHTNFNNTDHTVHHITLDQLLEKLQLLEYLFHEPERLKPADIQSNLADRPCLSISFEQVEPVSIGSSFGLVNQYGGKASPLSGGTEFALILHNSSYRTAKLITVDLETKTTILNRPKILRTHKRHHRIETTQDTYCLPDDKIVLGHLDFGIIVTADHSPELNELTRQMEEEIRRLENDAPSERETYEVRRFRISSLAMKLAELRSFKDRGAFGFADYDDIQSKLVSLYHQDPARDIYTLTYKVRAEGFASFQETKKIEIHWSNRFPQCSISD